MERYYSRDRPPTRRRPLVDATSRLNAANPAAAMFKAPFVRQASPLAAHARSPALIGASQVCKDFSRRETQNGQISAHGTEMERETKRDSAMSNTSTDASTGHRRKSHIGPWQLGKTIGRGGCSRVRAVRHAITGQVGAAKIISKSTAESVRAISLANLIKTAKQDASLHPDGKPIPFGLEREIVIMKLLDHRNIVKLYDVWENRNEIYIIMEYVPGGELFNYISERRGLDEDEAVYLFRQIIAALLYCHRINIHHRDLKPENILLDTNTHNLKLVDFGMAALQPAGRYLSTPCGSPHYAAPEVIRAKCYDGSKADVWSCGVILFVMLAGYPPFNYTGEERDLKDLFKSITNADYIMPDSFSSEAQDLMRRILVADPRKRINIENVWHHPFLHKYDVQFGVVNSSIESQIGPCPRVEDWVPLTKHTIDREILRNMRTLWHSEAEECLIEKLISPSPNQEKYFYGALLKHRNDQLENLVETPSDHHHVRSTKPNSSVQEPQRRTTSQFTILNKEHLYSKHSFYEPPPSNDSYDPFRASRDPILTGKNTKVNVTVHRGSSGASTTRRVNAIHGANSLRIQTLRRSGKRCSSGLSTPQSRSSSVARRSTASQHRSVSHVSLCSSMFPSSPPVVVAVKPSYKRGVSFTHLRRSSAMSSVVVSDMASNAVETTPERQRIEEPSSDLPVQAVPLSPKPGEQSNSEVVAVRAGARKPAAPGSGRLKISKPSHSPTHLIETAARKVSTELDKLCEEAFFRTSIGSKTSTSVADKPSSHYDTSPSSVSNDGNSSSFVKTSCVLSPPFNQNDFKNRPLPPVPVETPNTFIAREIAETRARLARRYEEEGDTTANFDAVLAHLDKLLQQTAMSSRPPVIAAKRAASAPQPKQSDYTGHLPVISEEGRPPEACNVREENKGYRSVTDPVWPSSPPHQPVSRKPAVRNLRHIDHKNSTIRVVEPSSPSPVAPLNIRKRSGVNTITRNKTVDVSSEPVVALAMPKDLIVPRAAPSTVTSALHTRRHNHLHFLSSGEEQDSTRKKRAWFFGRKGRENKENSEVDHHAPAVWADLGDRMAKASCVNRKETADPKHNRGTSDPLSTSTMSNEFPMRSNLHPPQRNGFLRFFSKFGAKPDISRLGFDAPHDFSTSSISSSHEYSGSAEDTSRHDYQSNWIARFLHIKPASKIVCFQVGRGRARQELVRLLRDWKRFGVRDICFDRQKNTITAGIAKHNHLNIRPVGFVVELFVVLEHGRRAQLSLARWTQTKGAASSFSRVVELVENVCSGRGLLVEDEEKKAVMKEIVETAK